MKTVLGLAAVAAASLALGCCSRVSVVHGSNVTAVEEIAVEPGSAVALSVETSAGNIQVGPTLAEKGAMIVRATKSARTEADLAGVHPFARVEGDTIRVGYTRDPGIDGVGVSFSMEPPALQRMRLRTSAGNVTVEGIDGSVDAETSAGNVTVSGRLRGPCRVETSAGNLTVAVPADSKLKVDGHTTAGNARSEHAVAASSRYAASEIVGTLGDGSGGTLEMRTSAGNLVLRKIP